MDKKETGSFVVGLSFLAVCAFCAVCWVGNAVKLIGCDWDSKGSWKGEIVHAIGLLGPTAVVTVWSNEK